MQVRNIKEGCSSFKQERYRVCKNVCSIAVACGASSACVYNCRYAVSLSDCSPCFPSLYASLCLSSFTGRLIIQPPGINRGALQQTEGQTLKITCRYQYGSGRSGAGNWTWYGPAVREGRAIIRHGDGKSILRVNALSAEDNGTYICLCSSQGQAATVDIMVHSEYALCVRSCQRTLQIEEGTFPNLSQKMVFG